MAEGVTLFGVTEGVTLFGATEGVLDTTGVVEGFGATEFGAAEVGAVEPAGHIEAAPHELSVNVHEK